MIPRITKGTSAHAALAYDFGPGRREEHEDPRTVAGNLPGTWWDQAALLDDHAARRPELTRPVWRSALRAAPEDRTLSDEEWGRVAQRYVQRMGFGQAPWTATRHGEDHIHVTACRLDWNGQVVADSHDYARAQSACRSIEHEFGLVDASRRYDRQRPQVSHGERERAERRGVPAEREQLRERLEVATTRSEGSVPGYERALGEAGVVFRRTQAATGRLSGYSYGLDGHTDAHGRQVFFTGSQLGKDYRWGQVQQRVHDQPQRPGPGRCAAEDGSSERAPARARARAALERLRGTGAHRSPVERGNRQGLMAGSAREGGAPRLGAATGNVVDDPSGPDGWTGSAARGGGARDGRGRPAEATRAALQRVREHHAARQRDPERDRGVGR